jgi:hypothetical protein
MREGKRERKREKNTEKQNMHKEEEKRRKRRREQNVKKLVLASSGHRDARLPEERAERTESTHTERGVVATIITPSAYPGYHAITLIRMNNGTLGTVVVLAVTFYTKSNLVRTFILRDDLQ